MSLSASGPKMFVANEQADNALLIANGVTYHCKVYLNTAVGAVEAVCKRVQPDGSRIIVFHNVVARASSTEFEDTQSYPLDCPKIIAVGATFVVHWIQATDIPANERNWQLYRATMDMTAFDITSWTNRGAVAIRESHVLYDVCNALQSTGTPLDSEFVVARVTDDDEITVARYDGFDWIDTSWTVQLTGETIAHRVLGVYAHFNDSDVVVVYQQSTTGLLRARRVAYTTGGSGAGPTTVFNSFLATFSENETQWLQIGFARTASNRVAVFAECLGAESQTAGDSYFGLQWVHHVCFRVINTDTVARVGNEHWRANLHMLSRPWSYRSGTAVGGSTVDVYCAVGFRSVVEAQEWSQSYAYICNFDLALWDTVATGAGICPRPIATYWTLGVPDVRAAGWKPQEAAPDLVHGGPAKRMNHLSHACEAPAFGPDSKTRTIAMVAFSTIAPQSDDNQITSDIVESDTVPERSVIGDWVITLEDPWIVWRDATLTAIASQPIENFKFPYARAMHQTCHAGKSLFIGGGTPQLYDGNRIVECGYPWKPELLDAHGTDSGDLTALGTYGVYIVYSQVDSKGQMHRSGPSNLAIVTLTGAQQSIVAAMRCQNLSLRDADAIYPLTGPISIDVYMTASITLDADGNFPADGTATFYRYFGSADQTDSFAVIATPINDPEETVGAVTISLSIPDATLVLQGQGPYQLDINSVFPAMQSAGGNPVPCTVPAMDVVANFQNRIWGASAIDPSVVWYTYEILPDLGADFYQAPVFTTNQVFPIGEIGEITGMAEMGSSLWVFTRSSIYALSAGDAGAGLLNVLVQKVHGDTGCVDPRTIVLFYGGIGFQSQRGYEILGRDGQLAYGAQARTRDSVMLTGGAAIEDDLFETGNIRAASALENEHLILLVGNGTPVTTQTWEGTVTTDNGGSPPSTWTIDGLDEPISLAVADGSPDTIIAAGMETRVQLAIDADAPDTLRFQVASVNAVGATITIVLQPGDTATITSTAPVGEGGNAIDWALTEETETQPWVLAYNTYFQQWSRWELPQTNANTRLAEAVAGCTWRGDGGSCHVVLCQGSILIQRQPDDADAYADETSVAQIGIPLDLTWAWWHLAGIVGAQRLWEITVQTQRHNQAELFATLEYDRDGFFTGQELNPTAYTWPRTGETVTPHRVVVRPRYQTAGAHRLRLYEDDGVTTLNTFSVTGLALSLGVQSKKAKTRPALRGET